MIDTSGKSFADFQNRLDARIATIVKITHDSDVWYLGDMEIEWGAGVHVYGMLTSYTGVKYGIDPFRKKWSVGEVTLTFSNLPFKKDSSGNWLRPSDDINAVETDQVEIYLLCGENATGLSDCILCFSGLLKEPPKYDENTWGITIVDRSNSLLNQMVPTKTVGSIYSDAPEDYKNDPIPLIYGEFKHTGYQAAFAFQVPIQNSLGLCRGIPTNNDIPSDCVFSDHTLHTFETVFWQPSGFVHPAEFYASADRTLSTDDSGYGTSVFDSNRNRLLMCIRLSNTNMEHYSFEDEAIPISPDNVWDRKESTYAMIKDNVSDNGTAIVGEGRWGFNNDATILSHKNEVVGVDPTYESPFFPFWGIIYRVEAASGVSSPSASMYLYYSTNGTTNVRYPVNVGDWPLTLDASWHGASTAANYPFADKKTQYLVGVHVESASGGDSTLNNKNMLKVFDLWFWLYGHMPGIDIMLGQIKGRTFGSWIDGAGHSNSFDAGDLMEDPAYIIESLLRDELNWITGMIDEASFDAAANSSVIMRMNLTKRATVARIIRQICEQSTFAFHVNCAGKARLIPLNESSPSTDRTIPFSHIKADTLRVTKVGPFVNYLTYHSCWLPQLGKYRNIDTAYDGGSWSNYGKHEQVVYWPNIEGTSVNHIYDHLLSITTGLWSKPRNVIEFETFGFTNADVEIGDWIELDDETWDAQLKLKGASWSGEQFLVTEVTQKQNGTRIKAIAI